MTNHPTDEALLTAVDPQAFGVFYARHLDGVERYFARRVANRELAADLAAETFAAALVARRRFVPGSTPAAGWLYTIAARRLVDYQRRAAVERRARESLESEARVEARWAAPSVEDDAEPALLQQPARRAAPRGRRARPARAELRADRRGRRRVGGVDPPARVARPADAARAARRLPRGAGADAPGPPVPLRRRPPDASSARSIRATPLDCSSAASLLLKRAGALESDTALTSGRLAEEWGVVGEGRHVTLWANDEHVWLEFKLDGDHGERFDPTPSRLAPDPGWLAARSGPKDEYIPRHLQGL